MAGRWSIRIVIFVATILAGGTALGQDKRNYASFYVARYGTVTGEEDARVSRAEAVFARVSAAADKKANRYPELVVLRTGGEPWALSLPDGSVVVTLGALDICYEGAAGNEGDARIAFVFGHELAHLAKDDFWQRPAFDAVSRHMNEERAATEFKDQLRETPDEVRKKELQADSFGIIYMTMAGYDPGTILSDRGGGFFDHWAAKIGGGSGPQQESPSHHTPQARADFLKAQLKRVVDHLDYFDLGVRFYQIGSWEDALAFLSEYKKEYPGREVFNNIGLVHYQLAAEYLAACDPSRAYAFKLSLAVDATTTGVGSDLRAVPRQGGLCGSFRRNFEERMERAILNLRVAQEKDPYYLPAKLNLSSALAMLGRYSESLGVIDSALDRHPNNAAALNNKAVALYLFGKENGVDTTERVLGLLTRPDPLPPAAAETLYNRAAVLEERGRTAEAKKAREAFLQVEPNGAYAAFARRKLGLDAGPAVDFRKTKPPTPPVKLGPVENGKELLPQILESRRFALGDLTGEISKGRGVKVLVVDYRVEIVETELAEPVDSETFRTAYGEPERTWTGQRGNTWVYATFAADVTDGRVTRLAYF